MNDSVKDVGCSAHILQDAAQKASFILLTMKWLYEIILQFQHLHCQTE